VSTATAEWPTDETAPAGDPSVAFCIMAPALFPTDSTASVGDPMALLVIRAFPEPVTYKSASEAFLGLVWMCVEEGERGGAQWWRFRSTNYLEI